MDVDRKVYRHANGVLNSVPATELKWECFESAVIDCDACALRDMDINIYPTVL
jgi:hypothetical protein